MKTTKLKTTNNKLYLNLKPQGTHSNDASPAPDTAFFIAHRFTGEGEPEIVIGHKQGDSYSIAVSLCTQDCHTLVNRMNTILGQLDAGEEPTYSNPTAFQLPCSPPVSDEETGTGNEEEHH